MLALALVQFHRVPYQKNKNTQNSMNGRMWPKEKMIITFNLDTPFQLELLSPWPDPQRLCQDWPLCTMLDGSRWTHLLHRQRIPRIAIPWKGGCYWYMHGYSACTVYHGQAQNLKDKHTDHKGIIHNFLVGPRHPGYVALHAAHQEQQTYHHILCVCCPLK